MSRSINKVILVGSIGRDPDVQVTAGGEKVAYCVMATSRRIPRANGVVEERTEWHRIVCWGRLAQLAEDYVRKGDRVYIEGRMEYDSYERNGVVVPTAEIQVRELVMLGIPRADSYLMPDEPEAREESDAERFVDWLGQNRPSVLSDTWAEFLQDAKKDS